MPEHSGKPVMNLSSYHSMVFDCDGVILNSNQVKTDAFYEAALPYGEAAARSLVEFHVSRGGISRYAKFEYFLNHIVGGTLEPERLQKLLDEYAALVRHGLQSCAVADRLEELRDRTHNVRWLVVSGSDQSELREVFAKRGLDRLFEGGIFGSPDSKDDILAREIANKNIIPKSVFIGDSQYDYEAAKRAGLDFIYLSDWSESAHDFSGAELKAGAVHDLLAFSE